MLKDAQKLQPYDYAGACMFYLGAVLVTLVMQALGGVVSSALQKTYGTMSGNGDFSAAFMICIQAANAAFIILYSRLKKRSLGFEYVARGESAPITPSEIVVPVIAAAVLMVGMYLPTIWYGYLTRAMGIPESYGNINLDTVSSVVMIVIASVFLAPVFEESIYRGVLLHGLVKEKSAVKAVVLSALAFMLMHMSPVQVVFQFALGIVCGAIALKCKKLLPSIILHASANALALVMQLTPFSAVLASCVEWLTANAAAAFFITLGLFGAGGGALFVLVKFGLDIKSVFAARRKNGGRPTDEDEESEGGADAEHAAPVTDGGGANANAAVTVRRELARSDGTLKYWIGIGICAVMFIVNLVTGILA